MIKILSVLALFLVSCSETVNIGNACLVTSEHIHSGGLCRYECSANDKELIEGNYFINFVDSCGKFDIGNVMQLKSDNLDRKDGTQVSK